MRSKETSTYVVKGRSIVAVIIVALPFKGGQSHVDLAAARRNELGKRLTLCVDESKGMGRAERHSLGVTELEPAELAPVKRADGIALAVTEREKKAGGLIVACSLAPVRIASPEGLHLGRPVAATRLLAASRSFSRV